MFLDKITLHMEDLKMKNSALALIFGFVGLVTGIVSMNIFYGYGLRELEEKCENNANAIQAAQNHLKNLKK